MRSTRLTLDLSGGVLFATVPFWLFGCTRPFCIERVGLGEEKNKQCFDSGLLQSIFSFNHIAIDIASCRTTVSPSNVEGDSSDIS